MQTCKKTEKRRERNDDNRRVDESDVSTALPGCYPATNFPRLFGMADECPVDRLVPPHPVPPTTSTKLPTERETSSIPRSNGEKWAYPSQAQFYAAMERKKHNPQEQDMKVLVPIHNAVNERAWSEVMSWESGQGGDKCGGVKLVSFKGRPGERSLRARWKILLGYVLRNSLFMLCVDSCRGIR
jgi:cytochrome c heme-lyase